MNYKEKYLKYKLKYLNFKNKLRGGGGASSSDARDHEILQVIQKDYDHETKRCEPIYLHKDGSDKDLQEMEMYSLSRHPSKWGLS